VKRERSGKKARRKGEKRKRLDGIFAALATL
jgi:hypothetical protein